MTQPELQPTTLAGLLEQYRKAAMAEVFLAIRLGKTQINPDVFNDHNHQVVLLRLVDLQAQIIKEYGQCACPQRHAPFCACCADCGHDLHEDKVCECGCGAPCPRGCVNGELYDENDTFDSFCDCPLGAVAQLHGAEREFFSEEYKRLWQEQSFSEDEMEDCAWAMFERMRAFARED